MLKKNKKKHRDIEVSGVPWCFFCWGMFGRFGLIGSKKLIVHVGVVTPELRKRTPFHVPDFFMVGQNCMSAAADPPAAVPSHMYVYVPAPQRPRDVSIGVSTSLYTFYCKLRWFGQFHFVQIFMQTKDLVGFSTTCTQKPER